METITERELTRGEANAAAHECADLRTLPARIAMGLSNISERECCLLIGCLTNKIKESGWGHTDAAQFAMERLTDAHEVLEVAAEQGEQA